VKYGVLVVVIGASWHIGTLVFRRYDPYLAAFDFGASLDELWPGYIMLGLVVLGSLWIERFWCRYACPLGALLGLMSRIGIMKIAHEEGTCKNCKAGIHRCPVGINPTLETDLRSAECIQCMECVAVCPIHNAVHVEAFGKRMRPAIVGVSIAGAFLLVIVAAQYLGAWQTLHGRQRGRSVWNNTDVTGRMVTGAMTLDGLRRMYGMDESGMRRVLGIRAEIPMDMAISRLRQADPNAVPSPDEIENILAGHTQGKARQAQSIENSRSLAPGSGQSTEPSTRPRGRGGMGRASSGSSVTLRGSTTLQEALAYSGITMEQLKEDWNLSFVDPQTNLGTLARTIGVPMRELRDYFQK
jgi:ferredoxin